MIREFRLGLEFPKPLGRLSRKDDRESALFDLLPTDVVDQDMNGCSVYVFKHGSEFRSRRVNELVVLQEVDVGRHHPSFFGAEGFFDQA